MNIPYAESLPQDLVGKSFIEVSKLYSLENSYFKSLPYTWPKTPEEIMLYFLQNNKLPFKGVSVNENWFYHVYCEYQKRSKVYHDQFFTPYKTAQRMAELAQSFGTYEDDKILDACCGFGQLTLALKELEFKNIIGFDYSYKMEWLYKVCTDCNFISASIEEFEPSPYSLVISNPPYNQKDLSLFFEKLPNLLTSDGVAVLLLPDGYLKKSTKAITKFLDIMEVTHDEPMTEKFLRTNLSGRIYVLTRI